jgi:membrane protein YqaA with SNARE-associated domain
MSTAKIWESRHFKRYYGKQLKKLAITLGVLLGAVALAGWLMRAEIDLLTHWISENFGIQGLMILTTLCDSIPSPISPDITLVLIAGGPLAENGWQNAFFVSLASVSGGHLAYWIGVALFRKKFLGSLSPEKLEKQSRRIKKWGVTLVVLGAITPFPMSITCIAAGLGRLPYGLFTLATLVRVPRLLIAYGLISALH